MENKENIEAAHAYGVKEQDSGNAMPANDLLFAKKVGYCIYLLGGGSDLLGSIGAWRAELSDSDVLGSLDAWIHATIGEKMDVISHVQRWHKIS